jgi:glycosyltransferase involved in cell wall biosynthesis
VEERRSAIHYRVESAETNGEVRLVETFPRPIERDDIEFPADSTSGSWEQLDPRRLSFVCEGVDSGPVESRVRIRDVAVDPEDLVTEVVLRSGDDGEADLLIEDGSKAQGTVDEEYRTDGSTAYTGRETGADFDGTTIGSEVEARKPAVGVVLSEENRDAAVRTVLRATERGHAVYVTCDETPGDAGRFAERLGATIVGPESYDGDHDQHRVALTAVARNDSFPGLILQTGDRRMDFRRSERRFWSSDASVVEAVPEVAATDVMAGIPAYNEAATIGDVVREAEQYVDEVVVVDDGSTDGTADAALNAGATVVRHESNRGYGGALKTLFREGDDRGVDHLVVLDGDSQHDPKDIPRLLDAQRESGAGIIIGNRFDSDATTEMPRYRRFGLGVINAMVNLSMGNFRRESRIRDAQSGFRAYDRPAIAALSEQSERLGDRMNASVDILYRAREEGLETVEVGTTIDYEVTNASSRNPVSHGMNVVNHILKTLEQKQPITVLGVPGFLVALVGIGLGYWTVSDYLTTGSFSLAVALVSAVLVLSGTLSAFTSAVLHSLNAHFDGDA